MNSEEDMIEMTSNNGQEKLGNQKSQQPISGQPILIEIGRQYTFDQITDIWTYHKIKESTSIKAFQQLNQISFICEGKKSLHEDLNSQENDRLHRSLQNPPKYSQALCTFYFDFSIHQNLKKDQILQQNDTKCQPYQLSNKIFQLQSVCLKHSEQCLASDINFIQQRNFNFIEKNQDLLQYLIKEKYDITNKLLTPTEYVEFIRAQFGYDFLFHGLPNDKSRNVKNIRARLKKKFDNIVQKARKSYGIPSSKKKSKSKRKVLFRLLNQNQIEKSNEKSTNQQEVLQVSQSNQEDSQFQPSSNKWKSQSNIKN